MQVWSRNRKAHRPQIARALFLKSEILTEIRISLKGRARKGAYNAEKDHKTRLYSDSVYKEAVRLLATVSSNISADSTKVTERDFDEAVPYWSR